ncbi:hypothetical protein ACFL6W_00650 [Thermodesulfobacteriota bacterium]
MMKPCPAKRLCVVSSKLTLRHSLSAGMTATENGKARIYLKMDPCPFDRLMALSKVERLHGDDTQVPNSAFYESIKIHG